MNNINVAGIGPVQYTTVVDYVPAVVSAAYTAPLTAIQGILDNSNPSQLASTDYDNLYNAIAQLQTLGASGVSDTTNPTVKYYMTADMTAGLQNVMAALQSAGIPSTPSVATDSVKAGLIQQYSNSWSDLKGFGVDQILTNALGVYGGVGAVASTASSLQTMIELDYVKLGNQVLMSSLNSLEQALQTNQNSLNTLNAIQNVSSKIQVATPGTFNFPPATFADIPSSLFSIFITQTGTRFTVPSGTTTDAAHYLFNLPSGGVLNKQFLQDFIKAGGVPPVITVLATSISPTSSLAWTTYPSGSNQLIDPNISRWNFNVPPGLMSVLKTETGFASGIFQTVNVSVSSFTSLYKLAASAFFTQQKVVSTATSADAANLFAALTTLKNNIASVEALSVQPPYNRTIPNTLPYFLNQVVQGISAAFAVPGVTQLQATNSWILDGQNVSLSQNSTIQGVNQLNVNQAITASQSLNDSQQQNVQNAMFIFQEFYKSSSAVLQSIDDLITKMAQTIRS